MFHLWIELFHIVGWTLVNEKWIKSRDVWSETNSNSPFWNRKILGYCNKNNEFPRIFESNGSIIRTLPIQSAHSNQIKFSLSASMKSWIFGFEKTLWDKPHKSKYPTWTESERWGHLVSPGIGPENLLIWKGNGGWRITTVFGVGCLFVLGLMEVIIAMLGLQSLGTAIYSRQEYW